MGHSFLINGETNMNTLIINTISLLVKQLISGNVWNLIVTAVNEANKTEVSGEEKREQVLSTIQPVAISISTWLINLAIETAVARLKTIG